MAISVVTQRALAREHWLWEAYRRGGLALRSLLLPDALDVSSAGVLNRDGVLAYVSKVHIETFAIDDLKVLTAGDVEVVTSKVSLDGTVSGKPFAAPVVRSTTVWMRREETWRVLLRQETAVK
jgi:hypothetical protein